MIEKIKHYRVIQRVIVYTAGLFVLAWGVTFSIGSALGVSPVNSIPYVLSRIFLAGTTYGEYAYTVYGHPESGLWTTPGPWATVMFVFFILLQIAILRKKFRWFDVIQIFFSFAFGFFLDLTLWMMGSFRIPTYFGQLTMLIISIALIAIGLVLIIGAKIVALPPEALCLAIVTKIKNSKFHIVKIIVDSSLVIIAIILSLVFLRDFIGVREGTVISAVAIGKAIPYARKILAPVLSKLEVAKDEGP